MEGAEAPDDSAAQKEPPKAEPGWQAILNVLLAIGKCDRVPETEPVVSLRGSQPQTSAPERCSLLPSPPGPKSPRAGFGADELALG